MSSSFVEKDDANSCGGNETFFYHFAPSQFSVDPLLNRDISLRNSFVVLVISSRMMSISTLTHLASS